MSSMLGWWLWHDGHIRSFLAHTPWVRQIVERVARGTLDIHRKSLGPLGYIDGLDWIAFPDDSATDESWGGHLSPLITRDSIGIGVEAGHLLLQHPNGAPFTVILVTVNLDLAEVRILVNNQTVTKRAFVKNMAERTQAIAAINGGFFDPQGALGLVLSDGNVLRPANGAQGYLLFKDSEVSIRKDSLAGIQEGIQSIPLLLVDGAINDTVHQGTNTHSIARRLAAGVTMDGKLLLLSTNCDIRGLTISQLAILLRGLDAQHALALDGGGSAQLYT